MSAFAEWVSSAVRGAKFTIYPTLAEDSVAARVRVEAEKMDEKARRLLAAVFGLTRGRLADGVAAADLGVLLKWNLAEVRSVASILTVRSWANTITYEWGEVLYLTARGADEAESLASAHESGVERSISRAGSADLAQQGN